MIEVKESLRNSNSKKHSLLKSRAFTCKTIYVYCPDSLIEKVKEIENAHNFSIVINDRNIENYKGKVICHYGSSDLSIEDKMLVVRALEYGGWVESLVDYIELRVGYTEVSLLNSGYFLHQKAFGILSNKRTQFVKRFVDIFSALLLLIITLPIGLVVALLIKLESKGPVFYKQERTGLYNKVFKVIKFRSMHSEAEKNGAQWADKNDSRITRVGKFIRATRIDELPQVINILNGDMSIVGPRPEREVFIKELEKEIPYYRFRHAVKPGVTGLAQVSYPYGSSLDDAVWKHKYDIHYIKNHSTWTDIKILVKTFKVVLLGMGQ